VSYLETAAKVVPADPPELAPRTLVSLTQAYRGAGDLDQAVQTSQRAVQVVETQLKTVSPTAALESARFEAWYALAAVRTEIANRVRRQEDYDRALGFAERLIQIAGEQLEADGTSLPGVERVQSAYGLQLQILYAYREILFERNPSGRLSDRLIPGMQGLAGAITGKTVDVMLRQADLDRTLAHFQIRQIAEMSVSYDGGTNPKSLMNLGTLQVATGQVEQAAVTFRRVLEIDPANELAQQQLDAIQAQRTAPVSSQPIEAATP
jgi:tetratricopeptide (TPR) repeat protein